MNWTNIQSYSFAALAVTDERVYSIWQKNFQRFFRFFKGTMKLFQTVCSNFAIVGIYPNLSNQKYPFCAKMVMVFVCNWLGTILYCVFFSRSVHNSTDYLELIYTISIVMLITIYYTIFVFKAKKFFQNIDMCEKIIDTSKQMLFVKHI